MTGADDAQPQFATAHDDSSLDSIHLREWEKVYPVPYMGRPGKAVAVGLERPAYRQAVS
jgi:hypothetical protein